MPFILQKTPYNAQPRRLRKINDQAPPHQRVSEETLVKVWADCAIHDTIWRAVHGASMGSMPEAYDGDES